MKTWFHFKMLFPDSPGIITWASGPRSAFLWGFCWLELCGPQATLGEMGGVVSGSCHPCLVWLSNYYLPVSCRYQDLQLLVVNTMNKYDWLKSSTLTPIFPRVSRILFSMGFRSLNVGWGLGWGWGWWELDIVIVVGWLHWPSQLCPSWIHALCPIPPNPPNLALTTWLFFWLMGY